jgi:uncharacterized membrane protein YkoI
MRFPGCLLLVLALGCGAVPTLAVAAERRACLSQDERRAAIATHKAVPLGRAIRVVKAKIGGDVVKARLCRQERGLVYLLTVLGQSGKVTRARVDAADGQWLDGS